MSAPPTILVWTQLAPHHHDRLAALAARLGARRPVLGVELAATSARYPWAPRPPGPGYRTLTLFPGRPLESVGELARTAALLRLLRARRPAAVFLCNYDRPHVLAAVWGLAVQGRPALLMADAKADDRPRRSRREAAKRVALAPIRGALVAGPRSRAYLEGLGVAPACIREGYDTVSVGRLRRLADRPPAPDGTPHAARGFVAIARFVPEKNLATALDAYARYRLLCAGAGVVPRGFTLVGDGPLRGALEARAPSGARFAGVLQDDGIARVLAEALALLLPSRVEPWGLVANEAVALGVPVLASHRAGATDTLVRDGVSGRVLGSDDVEGFARAMLELTRAPAVWRRLAAGAAARAESADAARFAEGAAELLEVTT